jgi:hypothetical protein
MSRYRMSMEILVFDEKLLMQKAQEQARRICNTPIEIAHPQDALIMLLDPGAGGDAYLGPLSEAGIRIEQSMCERLM